MDPIVAAKLMTPMQVMGKIAKAAKAKRLELNFTQQTLASRSGVSLGALKKFESSGKIALESLLKIALVLNSLSDFVNMFKPRDPQSFPTLDALLRHNTQRKRGRK